MTMTTTTSISFFNVTANLRTMVREECRTAGPMWYDAFLARGGFILMRTMMLTRTTTTTMMTVAVMSTLFFYATTNLVVGCIPDR